MRAFASSLALVVLASCSGDPIVPGDTDASVPQEVGARDAPSAPTDVPVGLPDAAVDAPAADAGCAIARAPIEENLPGLLFSA